MLKFISVTEVYANGARVPCLINAYNIHMIKKADKSSDTHIGMGNGKYYFVKESLKEVLEQINAE